MDKDRIVGAAKDFAGRSESAVGDLAGDTMTQARPGAEAAGTVQNSTVKPTTPRATPRTPRPATPRMPITTAPILRDGSQAIARTVKDNPLGALMVAGGIGFALALLMARPPRRPPQRWRY